MRRGFPQERQADDHRRKTVEEPAQRTRDGGAIRGAEPGDRVRETQNDTGARGKPAGFGERAQQVRASEHDERPADERHETGEVETAGTQQWPWRWRLDGRGERFGPKGWRRAQLQRLERVKAPMNVGERLIDAAKPRLDAGEAIRHWNDLSHACSSSEAAPQTIEAPPR